MTRLVDLILCLVVLEGTVLTMLYRIAGIGVQPRMALQTLAAGFLLLLALRLALSGAPWFALCGVLLLALCAHVADLWTRWRHRQGELV